MKIVQKTSQIKVSTGKSIKKSSIPFSGKISRFDSTKVVGKPGGTGLGNYNLDVMILD